MSILKYVLTITLLLIMPIANAKFTDPLLNETFQSTCNLKNVSCETTNGHHYVITDKATVEVTAPAAPIAENLTFTGMFTIDCWRPPRPQAMGDIDSGWTRDHHAPRCQKPNLSQYKVRLTQAKRNSTTVLTANIASNGSFAMVIEPGIIDPNKEFNTYLMLPNGALVEIPGVINGLNQMTVMVNRDGSVREVLPVTNAVER